MDAAINHAANDTDVVSPGACHRYVQCLILALFLVLSVLGRDREVSESDHYFFKSVFLTSTVAYRDIFIKNPDGSLYIGQVWPGYTVRSSPLPLLDVKSWSDDSSSLGIPRLVCGKC